MKRLLLLLLVPTMLFGRINEEDNFSLSTFDNDFQLVQLKGDSIKEKKINKIYASFSIGFFVMGPGSEIEQAMKENGFGDYSYCSFWCTGRISHPSSYKELSGSFQFRYLLTKISSVSLMLSKSSQGATVGYDNQSGRYLDLQYHTFTSALVYVVSLKNDRHNFLLGPSINAINVYGSYKKSITKLGLVGGYSVKPLNRARSFIELSLNYRLIGNIEIGPITKTSGTGESTFPATDITFNHLYIGIGYGRKF